jgi:hypothetical protein
MEKSECVTLDVDDDKTPYTLLMTNRNIPMTANINDNRRAVVAGESAQQVDALSMSAANRPQPLIVDG